MAGHETKGKIEPGAAPWEGEEQHGWSPDANKEGTEDSRQSSERSFESQEGSQEQPSNR